jgi:hypothetical protein
MNIRSECLVGDDGRKLMLKKLPICIINCLTVIP